jgi:hypothetical protein
VLHVNASTKMIHELLLPSKRSFDGPSETRRWQPRLQDNRNNQNTGGPLMSGNTTSITRCSILAILLIMRIGHATATG